MEIKYPLITIAAIIAAGIAAYFFMAPLTFQPGGEAPLTGTIELEIVERQLTEGAKVKVLQGEHLKATWDAEWWNRSLTWSGGNNIAGFWIIDGQFLERMTGQETSINTTYCQGTNPTPGCISEMQWDWKTLPIVATLPAQGGTTSITRETVISTDGLSKGMHQITVKAYMINGASEVGIFSCGTPNGVCCPLQTASQGFPCAGIHGTTQNRSKDYSARCQAYVPLAPSPPNWNYWICPNDWQWPECTGGQCGGYCGNYCCEKWGSGTGNNTFPDVGLTAQCGDWGPYRVWGGWSEWTQTVEQTEENVMANAISGGETVAVAEFEVVEKCPNECCIDQPGYQDKTCLERYVCDGSNTCVYLKTLCPYQCCAGIQEHFDKDCTEGYACTGNECELTVTDCPFDCCQNEQAYNNKECDAGKNCENNECKTTTPIPICGNGTCESGEDATNCPADCHVEGPGINQWHIIGIVLLVLAALIVIYIVKKRH